MVNILIGLASESRKTKSFKTTLTTPSFKTPSGIRDIMSRRATSTPRTQSTSSRTLTSSSEKWTSHLCLPNASLIHMRKMKSRGHECLPTPSLKKSATSTVNSVGSVITTSSAQRTTIPSIQLSARLLMDLATTSRCSTHQRWPIKTSSVKMRLKIL